MLWSEYRFDKIPFADIVGVGQRSLLQRDLFCVSWLLGRYCNYRCSYCWPYARADKKDHRPTELVKSTLDEIKRQARERGFNSFHFSFSGGEPTMHPGYLEILAHYAGDEANYQSLHMTSNMSPGLPWLKKYVAATQGLNRVSVTASFHAEFAIREKFLEKLLFLQDHGVQITINMVMVPARFEELWELASYFHAGGVNVTLKPQSNPTATRVVEGYSEAQLARLRQGMPQRDNTQNEKPAVYQVEMCDREGRTWYMDQAERFNAFSFNKFEGWECSAGFRSIIIREPDGVIKRSYSCNDAPLGHIETGFRLFDEPRLCQTPSCVSSADSKIPKRQCGAKFPLWPADKTYER